MKKVLLLLIVSTVFMGLASANQLCVNDNSLQQYITSYNSLANACQIADKIFWGFSLTGGPSASGGEPSASQIQVQDVPFDGVSNVGIIFNSGGWITSFGTTLDSIISYHVATASGFPAIKDATLTITGTLTGAGGSGTVTESLVPVAAGSPIVTTLPSPVSVNITFVPVSSFTVTDEVKVVGGVGFTDFSHISIVENDFSQVIPEPYGFALMGSGLVALGLVRRRRARR